MCECERESKIGSQLSTLSKSPLALGYSMIGKRSNGGKNDDDDDDNISSNSE